MAIALPSRLPAPMVLVACCSLLSGCGLNVPDAPLSETPTDVRAYVSGTAATDLDQTGRFRTAGGRPAMVSGVSPARARLIAQAYAERFGSQLRGPLFREHGGPIDFSALAPAERVYFAKSSYQDLPDSEHPGIKKRYGPYYIVHLFEGPRPALAVAVSLSSEKFMEDEKGIIRFFDKVGNDVLLYGLRRDEPIAFPITPEEAVAISHRMTGLKAVDVPELLLEPAPMTPFAARWRITLEQPATILGVDGRHYVTAQVYVGYRRKMAVGVVPDGAAGRLGSDLAQSKKLRDGIPSTYVEVKSSATQGSK